MLKQWFRDEKGQALTEYGLIIGVVALVIIAAVIAFRQKLEGVFNRVGTELDKKAVATP